MDTLERGMNRTEGHEWIAQCPHIWLERGGVKVTWDGQGNTLFSGCNNTSKGTAGVAGTLKSVIGPDSFTKQKGLV